MILGYALGRVTGGWLYAGAADSRVQKTGSCKHRVPFDLPPPYADR